MSFNYFYLSALIAISCTACNSGKQQVEPPCITERTILFEETEACSSGASVREYKFDGDYVYVFDIGDCAIDIGQTVVNYSCDTIGYLGGYAGSTEINGKDFYKKARLMRTFI